MFTSTLKDQIKNALYYPLCLQTKTWFKTGNYKLSNKVMLHITVAIIDLKRMYSFRKKKIQALDYHSPKDPNYSTMLSVE